MFMLLGQVIGILGAFDLGGLVLINGVKLRRMRDFHRCCSTVMSMV